MTTYLAAAIVGISFLVGLVKGLIGALMDILSLVLTIAAVIFLSRPLGAVMASRGWFQGLLPYLLAPFFLILSVGLVTQIASALVQRKVKRSDMPRLRLAGGVAETLVGVFYASIGIWAILAFRGITGQGTAPTTPVERFSGKIVAELGNLSLQRSLPEEPLVRQVSGSLLADPGSGLKTIRGIASSPKFSELLSDREFQTILSTGDRDAVERDPRFQSLFDDPKLETAFSDLGLMETEESRTAFRRQLADSMILAWRRLDRIRSDPEVTRVLNEPEVRRALEERDLITLFRNTEFTGIIGRILGDEGKKRQQKETTR